MTRLIRLAVAAAVAAPGVSLTGCGPTKSEGQPNPDLKAPDVPPAAERSGPSGKNKDDAKHKKSP